MLTRAETSLWDTQWHTSHFLITSLTLSKGHIHTKRWKNWLSTDRIHLMTFDKRVKVICQNEELINTLDQSPTATHHNRELLIINHLSYTLRCRWNMLFLSDLLSSNTSTDVKQNLTHKESRVTTGYHTVFLVRKCLRSICLNTTTSLMGGCNTVENGWWHKDLKFIIYCLQLIKIYL